jgi:hypothetical protein
VRFLIILAPMRAAIMAADRTILGRLIDTLADGWRAYQVAEAHV